MIHFFPLLYQALAKQIRRKRTYSFDLRFIWLSDCVDLCGFSMTCVCFVRAQIRTQVDASF